MKYKEKLIQKIEYSNKDIINWIKTFASKQLSISNNEILDSNITINCIDPQNISIIVIYEKESSN